MTDRSTKFSGRRPARRRFASFRAMVEVLDTRQLMAAGVTGVPMAISGNVDGPLRVQQYAMGPGGTIGLLNPLPLAPVGTPIPLVTLINNAAATLPASGYTGTVDWGDGSSTDSALFGTYTLPSYEVVPTNFLIVNGPEHTYTQPGTYTITIAEAGPGDTSPTVYTDTATISNAPALTGQLNPTSDTGASDSDNITANRTPNFTGTTQPGASVTLFATSSTSEQTLEVGAGVADAAGNWSITTVPLADGSYFFNAAATSTFGGTTRLPITSTNPFASSFLIIDTAGPTITRFQVTNARKGTFQVTFADPYGLLINPTTDPTNYVVNRPSPTPRKGQAFAVASLTVSDTTTNAYAPLFSASTISVVGRLNGSKPLIAKNGTYVFTIHSAGVVSLAGAPLDGEFTGKLPTGDGNPGGDFQVKVNVRNGKASGPIAIAPVKPTTHFVKIKAAPGKHSF